MDSDYLIEQYTDDKEGEWDDFIYNQSINGTFLQSRHFLNYHPAGRFQDLSYMVYDKKQHLIAVCPGCVVDDGQKRMYISHKGSTFGGVVFNAKSYYAHKVIDILSLLELTLRQKKIFSVEYRITPDLFSKQSDELLEYGLYYLNYQSFNELNTCIIYADYKKDILANFDQGKRTNIHNCIKGGLVIKELNEEYEIMDFYDILLDNLKKYHTKPVHILSELIDFQKYRLQNECGFWGAYQGDKMLGGAMMFYFNRVGVAHTQYLCSLAEYHTLSPMTFLYYSMIKKMKEQGYKAISFGISTEDHGKILNYGLTRSKEAYGGRHFLNRTYYKIL